VARIEQDEIKTYFSLHQFLKADHAFGAIVTDDNINGLYRLHIYTRGKAPKPRALSLVEVCAFFGLNKHLHFLLSEFDVNKQLSRERFRAYRLAIMNGHLDTFNLLAKNCPEAIQEVIKRVNYMIFRFAVSSGSLPCVKRLVELSAEPFRQHMISAHAFEALDLAIMEKDEKIIFFLLSFPYVFTHLSRKPNNKLTNILLNAFIDSKLNLLKTRQEDRNHEFYQLTEKQIDLYITILDYLSSNHSIIDHAQAKIERLISVEDVRVRLKKQ
jgi:hypothetical protein